MNLEPEDFDAGIMMANNGEFCVYEVADCVHKDSSLLLTVGPFNKNNNQIQVPSKPRSFKYCDR